MFFKKKKKQQPIKKPVVTHVKNYEIPYSRNFRGFKRFHMRVHGDEVAEKNSELLYNKDLSGSTFKFVCYNTEWERVADLYVDSLKVGTVYDSDQIFAIENGLIEKIHSEPKEEVILGNKKTITRHRLSILVKYKAME